MTIPVALPDLALRSLRVTAERVMDASPAILFRAWTEQFDRWFAAPGTVLMHAEVNSVFFFETHYRSKEGAEAQRYPHYGRFLRLEPDRRVKITWVTGAGGTKGAETVVNVALEPHSTGAYLRLTHAGFPDEESRDSHAEAWPIVLAQLDRQTTTPR